MNSSNELVIPALRAHMGDWIYYLTFLQMDEIAKRIHLAQEIHSSTNLNELIQREITDRASDISKYLQTQPQRFFNALIVGVYGGSPNWYELKLKTNESFDAETLPLHLEGALGIIRLDGTEKLFAIDGQHRVQGIKQALKENDVLNREEVSVIFVAHRRDSLGRERTRRLFTTLNRYAKPVRKSEIIALDEDDILAITTRELVEKYQLFKNKTSISRTKAVAVNDRTNFTSIIALYDVLEILFRKKGKKWNRFRQRRPEDCVITQYYTASEQFWDTMVEHFPPLKKISKNDPREEIAGSYRHRKGGNLLFRPIGLLIIAYVVRQAKDTGLTEQQAIKRISDGSLELTDDPWVGLLWDDTNHRMISGSTHQNVAKRLLFYMIGGELSKLGTSIEDVRREYAGLIHRNENEVKLPRYISN